jgi:peroxiredoxin
MISYAVQAGQPIPNLTLPLLAGGELAFADLRGKRALLFWWGSW